MAAKKLLFPDPFRPTDTIINIIIIIDNYLPTTLWPGLNGSMTV